MRRISIIPAGIDSLSSFAADPVPQALILTAIVIGFGVQAFLIVLIKRAVQATGTDDLDDLREFDRTEM
jgi:multicomponent Na+:H+ antiporter subunit C